MGLEGVVEFDDEWVIKLRAYIFLILDNAFLLSAFDELFEHDLHCVEVAITKISY